MRIIYMATAEIAAPVLQALHDHPDHEVVLVVSQPDRPQGRKRKILPSPVKALALELDLPVITPEKIGAAKDELAALEPDASVVFAYGQYIPSSITTLPRLGSVNLHPSLLPTYRGAAPIQWAIADGLEETGISVIRLAKKMDAGDIICQRRVTIDPDDTNASLSERMSVEAGSIIIEGLTNIADPDFEPTPQDDEAATEARKLEKADRELDWHRPAAELRNWIRACKPWPGSVMPWGEGEDAFDLKIHRVEVVDLAEDGMESGEAPGTVLFREEGPVVICGDGLGLRLVDVQPPGKKPMAAEDFVRGLRNIP